VCVAVCVNYVCVMVLCESVNGGSRCVE